MLKYNVEDELEVASWEELSGLIVKERADGVYYIVSNGVCSYVKISGFKKSPSSNFVLVGFQGAVNRNKPGPYFAFHGIASKLSIPCISFSDPSLLVSEEIKLGWFLGNDYCPGYPEDVKRFLDLFLKDSKKKIILAGGSGGGFAALNFANSIENKSSAVAVVWNPQVVIKNYNGGPVKDYLSNCCKSLPHLIDSKVSYEGARSIVMMDGLDHAHLRLHLRHYLASQGVPVKKGPCYFYSDTKVVVGDWGTGHSAPPKWLIEDQILSCMKSWRSMAFHDNFNFKKKVVDFSVPGMIDELKGVISFSAFLFNDSLLLKANLNEHFVGYQLLIKVYGEAGEAIFSSGWLKNQNHCSGVFSIKEEERQNVSKWKAGILLEDYRGIRKQFKYPLRSAIRKPARISRVVGKG